VKVTRSSKGILCIVFNRKSERPGQRIFGVVREGLFISHRDLVTAISVASWPMSTLILVLAHLLCSQKREQKDTVITLYHQRFVKGFDIISGNDHILGRQLVEPYTVM
jgi:hypothetical protein